MNAEKATPKSTKRTTATGRTSKGWTAEEQAAAKAYAQEQAKMYPTLIVGNTVVVAGTGLENTDMKAYLTAVQETAGGAGEILAKS